MTTFPSARTALVLSLILLPAAGPVAGEAAAPASPASARPVDTRGFLYGRVTTRTGTVYEGRIRWGKEEAFWGDLFQAGKADNPYEDLAPARERRKRETIKIFGIPIGVHIENASDRQLVARFGDIQRIEPRREGKAQVFLKSGVSYQVDGGSNDVEAKVAVWDRTLGQIDIEWDNLQKVEFLPTPANLPVQAHRLYGTVKLRDGSVPASVRGFLQWDQDECLSTDELDGETRDGDLSVPMGNVVSIERRLRGSQVKLTDGRTLELSGSNDVNSDNRGIFVDDPRFGRVLVSWKAMDRVDFARMAGTGPAYPDYRPGRPLFGKVTTTGGQTYRGRLVYDLDESVTSDFLDGDLEGISYSIPFARIASVEPQGQKASRVRLRDGGDLQLEEAVDVNEDNAGLLVYEGDGKAKPRYIAWEEVRRVDFENR
jgi:hypothetical protein